MISLKDDPSTLLYYWKALLDIISTIMFYVRRRPFSVFSRTWPLTSAHPLPIRLTPGVGLVSLGHTVLTLPHSLSSVLSPQSFWPLQVSVVLMQRPAKKNVRVKNRRLEQSHYSIFKIVHFLNILHFRHCGVVVLSSYLVTTVNSYVFTKTFILGPTRFKHNTSVQCRPGQTTALCRSLCGTNNINFKKALLF